MADPFSSFITGAVTGAATGASTGAAAGPHGAVVGGVIGAGIGGIMGHQQALASNRSAKQARRSRSRKIRGAIEKQAQKRQQADSLAAQIRSPEQQDEGQQLSEQGMIGEGISSQPSSAGTF